jgi:hypothetical protein
LKYNKTQYFDEIEKRKARIDRLQEKKDDLISAFYRSPEMTRLSGLIDEEFEALRTFKMEHYSDFRVYTNNERARDVRIDGKRLQLRAA